MREFLNEFLGLQHTLSFLPKNYLSCDCPSPLTFNENECNYNIIKNYMKIFDYVFDDTIDANINKIKVFGSQFAEILPSLQF